MQLRPRIFIPGRTLKGGEPRYIPLSDGPALEQATQDLVDAEGRLSDLEALLKRAQQQAISEGQDPSFDHGKFKADMASTMRSIAFERDRIRALTAMRDDQQAQLLQLLYDFAAMAEYEAEFTEDKDEDEPFDPSLLQLPSRKNGTLNSMSRWAYAMTATDREEKGMRISFSEFRKRIPTDPEGSIAWQSNVTACFLEQKNSGGEAGATSNVSGSASPSELAQETPSSGSSSTGLEPSSSSDQTPPSGG